MTITQLLLKILEIIDFKENKNVFIADFISLVNEKALINVLKGLPGGTQTHLEERLKNKTLDEQKQILQESIQLDDLTKELARVTQELLSNYIDTIMPTLHDDQLEKLQNVLSPIDKVEIK